RPHVSRLVWAMIKLQRRTGMLAGEVTIVRTGDFDTSGDVADTAQGVTCDCADQTFPHEGIDATRCKHVRAPRARRLFVGTARAPKAGRLGPTPTPPPSAGEATPHGAGTVRPFTTRPHTRGDPPVDPTLEDLLLLAQVAELLRHDHLVHSGGL